MSAFWPSIECKRGVKKKASQSKVSAVERHRNVVQSVCSVAWSKGASTASSLPVKANPCHPQRFPNPNKRPKSLDKVQSFPITVESKQGVVLVEYRLCIGMLSALRLQQHDNEENEICLPIFKNVRNYSTKRFCNQ